MAGEQHRHDISDRVWGKTKLSTIAKSGHRPVMLMIPYSLSGEHLGFCVRKRLGGICRKCMEDVGMYAGVSVGSINQMRRWRIAGRTKVRTVA